VSTVSKSPLRVASLALAVGTQVLPAYAHRFSPKKYTQPQLFACLVLKAFFRIDYRGITLLLEDLVELPELLGLSLVPHFSTLHKASHRLLRQPHVRRLLTATVRRLFRKRRRLRRAAFDSTGFDCSHASSYFVRRRARGQPERQGMTYKHFGKLELAVDCSRHLVIAAIPRRGPRVDVDRFVPLLRQVLTRLRLDTVVADAGYDSEPNHRFARQQCGVRSVIPATIGRPSEKPPTGRYRRLMRQRLNKDYCRYGQRWQVETVISMMKRRLGSVLYARSYHSQCRELMLRVLAFNLMVCCLRQLFYRAGPPLYS
jgi:hypothetical protein